jgi:hypothetical protein
MPVILIESGAKARKLEPQPLEAEKLLQKYIVENPACLPMDEIDEDLRLVLVAREFPAGSGSIDALGLDSDGGVYIIETKLYRNADKRRVLAQMLDYGAGLWHGNRGSGEFIAKVEEHGQRILERGVRAEIERAFELGGEETAQLLQRAAENVTAGSIRFVVLMDYIDDDLKNLIAFVNANSEFAIYGVELEFYGLEGDAKLAIPRLYGVKRPAKAARLSKRSGMRRFSSRRVLWWCRKSFLPCEPSMTSPSERPTRLSGDAAQRVRSTRNSMASLQSPYTRPILMAGCASILDGSARATPAAQLSRRSDKD